MKIICIVNGPFKFAGKVMTLVLWLILSTSSSRADYIAIDSTSSYTPGVPFTVDIDLTGVNGLSWYGIAIVFTSSQPLADLLSIDVIRPAQSRYIFPSLEYFYSFRGPAGADYGVFISDFTFDPPEVNVMAGINERVTTLVLQPSSALHSPISVFVEPDLTFLQLVDGTDLPLVNLPSRQIDFSSTTPLPVPAPPAAILVLTGIPLALAFLRRAL